MARERDVRRLNLYAPSVACVPLLVVIPSGVQELTFSSTPPHLSVCDGARSSHRAGRSHLHLQDASNLPLIPPFFPPDSLARGRPILSALLLIEMSHRYQCVTMSASVWTYVMLMPDYFDKVIQHLTSHWFLTSRKKFILILEKYD